MEIDLHKETISEKTDETTITITAPEKTTGTPTAIVDSNGKKESPRLEAQNPTLDADTLYPMFWSLQEYFSNPPKLFEVANLKNFKEGLTATLDKFKEFQTQQDSQGGGSKASDEPRQQGVKRKWEDDDESFSTFNPKYLTSRDLFELEVRMSRLFAFIIAYSLSLNTILKGVFIVQLLTWRNRSVT